MAAGSMLRVTQCFYLLNMHATPLSVCSRCISMKKMLEKLGLPEKPKKPASSFIMYRESITNDLMKKNQNISILEISKLAAKQWNEMSSAEKDKWKDKFLKEYEEYKTQLEDFEQSISNTQRAELTEAMNDFRNMKAKKLLKMTKEKKEKLLEKPKPPLVAFLKFVSASKPAEGEPRSVFMKRKAKEWQSVPEKQKQKYSEEYATQFQKYQADLLKWEEQMIKDGNLDLVRAKTLKGKLKMYED